MKYGITTAFRSDAEHVCARISSFAVHNLQCIRCVPRMCRDPARPRAARGPLLPGSAANRGACQCHVRSVGGAWSSFRSLRPIHTHAIHQTQVEMRPKSAHIAFFFLPSRRGPMLTMGLCDRSPARGVRSAGARRSAQMVILGIRVVVNSGLSNNYTGALATGRTNNRCVGSSLSLASLACHFLTYTFAAKDSSWRIPNNCTRRSSG